MIVFDYNMFDDMIIIKYGETFLKQLWKCQNNDMIIVKNHLHSQPIKYI